MQRRGGCKSNGSRNNCRRSSKLQSTDSHGERIALKLVLLVRLVLGIIIMALIDTARPWPSQRTCIPILESSHKPQSERSLQTKRSKTHCTIGNTFLSIFFQVMYSAISIVVCCRHDSCRNSKLTAVVITWILYSGN